MSRPSIAFTTIDSTESAGTLLVNTAKGNRQAGKVGFIRDVHLRQISGDGTQWRFRFYQGTTASPRETFLTYVDLPAVAGTFDNADGDEATSVPDSAKEFSTRFPDYSAGWTDEDTPIAGLGIYVSADQLANGGATKDAVTLTVTINRRG
tara:strand:+ start:118 stop:567 length:450 start_codon:yes stop_codon:yes gene_type:complete